MAKWLLLEGCTRSQIWKILQACKQCLRTFLCKSVDILLLNRNYHKNDTLWINIESNCWQVKPIWSLFYIVYGCKLCGHFTLSESRLWTFNVQLHVWCRDTHSKINMPKYTCKELQPWYICRDTHAVIHIPRYTCQNKHTKIHLQRHTSHDTPAKIRMQRHTSYNTHTKIHCRDTHAKILMPRYTCQYTQSKMHMPSYTFHDTHVKIYMQEKHMPIYTCQNTHANIHKPRYTFQDTYVKIHKTYQKNTCKIYMSSYKC